MKVLVSELSPSGKKNAESLLDFLQNHLVNTLNNKKKIKLIGLSKEKSNAQIKALDFLGFTHSLNYF